MIDGNNDIKVTIVLRTYNRTEFLKQALKSVEFQSSKDWELLIFDDLGSINNLTIINDFKEKNKDNRILYLTSQTPFDLFKKSWTYMSDLSEGDVIIRLDDDDLLSKDCVQYIKYIYQEYPDLDFSYGSSVFFNNENLTTIVEGMTPLELPKTTTAWVPYTIENNPSWNDPYMYQPNYYSEPQHYTSIIHASKLNQLCVYHTYAVRVNSLKKIKNKINIESNFVDDLEFMGTLEYMGLKHTSLKKTLTYVRDHDNERVNQNNKIRDNIDSTRRKVDDLRPNKFRTNLLFLQPKDKRFLEINDEVKSNFLITYKYCIES